MKLLKKNWMVTLLITVFTLTIISCKSDDNNVPPSSIQVIKANKRSIDFGKVVQGKKAESTKEVIIKVTNTSKKTIKGMLSKTTMSGGSLDVSFKFSPLAPGKSINIPVKFSAGTTKPGTYKGKVTLTPSGGKSIVINLSAIVIAAPSTDSKKLISLDKYAVDFGKVAQSKNSKAGTKEVIIKLTNNSKKTLTGLSSKATFPGSLEVVINFSPLAPGKSMNIPFKFAPGSTKPGDYKGKAIITPSIGEPIEVVLSATVI